MLNLASAVALLIVGANLDVDGAVVAEGRGGWAPIAGQKSALGVFGILTPELALRSTGHEAGALLAYSARIYDAAVDGYPLQSPLILHTGTLNVNLREGPRFSATAHATASYGKADFTFLPTIVGGTGAGTSAQAALPLAPEFMALGANLTTTGQVTRLWTLQTALEAFDRRPVGSTADMQQAAPTVANAALVFPTQRSIFLLPSLTGRLTRRDDLILGAGASFQTTDGQLIPGTVTGRLGLVEILSISESVGWRARLSRGYDFHVAVGTTYSRMIDRPPEIPDLTAGGFSQTGGVSALHGVIAPVGAIDLAVHLVTRREVTVRGQFGAVVDYYVDPILATSGPRGTTFAHMLVYLPLNWTAGLDTIFSTRLTHTQQPIGMVPVTTEPDETALMVAIPVRHLLSRNLAIEMGARAGARAPYVGSSNFNFHAPEAWLYVMLMATSRTIGDYRPD